MAAPNRLIQDRRSFIRSFTVQVCACIVLGSVVPTFFYFGGNAPFLQPGPIKHSLIASIIATIAAIFFARRVNIYPGVKQYGTVIPTFVSSFGIVAMGILALRIEYSIPVFGINAFWSTVIFLCFVGLDARSDDNVFYAVRGGRIERLGQMGLKTVPLREPILPTGQGAMIVADLHHDHGPDWEAMLARAALAGIPVFHFKQVYEAATGKVQVEHLSENSFGSLLPNMSFLRAKRVVDALLVLALAPLLLAPMLLVALFIKLESPGPALFRQYRSGYRGLPFKVAKFRTMRTESLSTSEDERRASAMTNDNDPRITRVGGFLRRTRIDELPQMWNILLGQMSWIGPRPEAVDLANWYRREIPFYDYRHIVRPGITGWAQVNQGHVTDLHDIDDKLQYDFYYIKNFSYWLDLLILARTAFVVLSGHGAR
ncbi:sugar transferase [Aurantiacibacter spongiae]|nr:sugar transferase [Aurantiacibacter spongiae]